MPRFLQIHTLTSYPGSLLNRDDVGFAKRLPFGCADRVRISSQCLKRHWRTADHEYSLGAVTSSGEDVPLAIRSRRTFDRYVYQPLLEGGIEPEIAQAVTADLIKTLFPGSKRRQAEDMESTEIHTSQVTVLGQPEVRYLLDLARQAAQGAEDVTAARKRWKELAQGDLRRNLQTLAHGAGLDVALFGRMVTGDVLARCDAAVHVAHAFTVHPGFFETDYFSAVDDLNPAGETGSGHINTSELTSGLYYGFVVVDVPLLVSNIVSSGGVGGGGPRPRRRGRTPARAPRRHRVPGREARVDGAVRQRSDGAHRRRQRPTADPCQRLPGGSVHQRLSAARSAVTSQCTSGSPR